MGIGDPQTENFTEILPNVGPDMEFAHAAGFALAWRCLRFLVYFVPKYCDEYVYLSDRITQKPHD